MFEYSCFISYRNSEHELGNTFVTELCEALAGELEQLRVPGIFRDRNHSPVGGLVDPTFARALCRSACMIAITNPSYFDPIHSYCAREYRAMELLEEQRRAQLQGLGINEPFGLILPIVYRGIDRLPERITRERFARDFSKYQLGGVRMSHNGQFNQNIGNIAAYIAERYEELNCLPRMCAECEDFALPSSDSLVEWLPGMLSAASPFPRGGRP